MAEVAAAIAAIDELIGLIDAATRSIAEDGAQAIGNLAQARAPKRTGHLASSILAEPAVNFGPRYGMLGQQVGQYTWSCRVGPTAVYGRIRELGGPIPGRGKHLAYDLHWTYGGRPVYKKSVHQTGTPYLRPAVEDLEGSYIALAFRRWAAAIESVSASATVGVASPL